MFSVGRFSIAAVALTAALLAAPALVPRAPAGAQSAFNDGRLDASYGTNGIFAMEQTLPAAGHSVLDVIAQPDGKIVTLAEALIEGSIHHFLYRQHGDGSFDQTFGAAGFTPLPQTLISFSPARTYRLGLQPDGHVTVLSDHGVAVPNAVGQAHAWRVEPNGMPDFTFEIVTALAPPAATRIGVLPDGGFLETRIEALAATTERPLVFRRYLQNGTLDGSFGMSGVLTLPIGYNSGARLEPPVVLATGEVLISGLVNADESGAQRLMLVRLTPALRPDEGFGERGVLVRSLPDGMTQQNLQTLQPLRDGKIVLRAVIPDLSDIARRWPTVARLSADGSNDTSFGTGGSATLPLTDVIGFTSYPIAPLRDGGLLLYGSFSGTTGLGGPNAGGLVRLTASGEVDSAFGTPNSAYRAGPNVAVLRRAPDGRILTGYALTVNDFEDDLRAGHTGVRGAHTIVLAATGDRDLSFGTAGVTTATLSYDGFRPAPGAAALLAGGRLLIGGRASGCRAASAFIGAGRLLGATPCGSIVGLDAHGRLDSSFNGSGYNERLGIDFAISGLTRSTGETLVISGVRLEQLIEHPQVASATSDGRLLQQSTRLGGDFDRISPVGVAVDEQGAPFVLARSGHWQGTRQFTALRYTTNLTAPNRVPDPALAAIPGLVSAEPIALAPGPGGSFLAAGLGLQPFPSAILARYTTSGTLDPTFGVNGVVSNTFGYSKATFRALAVLPDGAILAGGSAVNNAPGSRFLVARTLATGTLDTTFGQNGVISATFGAQQATVNAILPLPGGRYIVAGTVGGARPPIDAFSSDTATGPSYLAIGRYLPNGAPDPSFGVSGMLTMTLGGTTDSVESLLMQPDGKLLVVGTVGKPGQPPTLAVARLTNIDLAHYTQVANVLLRFPMLRP